MGGVTSLCIEDSSTDNGLSKEIRKELANLQAEHSKPLFDHDSNDTETINTADITVPVQVNVNVNVNENKNNPNEREPPKIEFQTLHNQHQHSFISAGVMGGVNSFCIQDSSSDNVGGGSIPPCGNGKGEFDVGSLDVDHSISAAAADDDDKIDDGSNYDGTDVLFDEIFVEEASDEDGETGEDEVEASPSPSASPTITVIDAGALWEVMFDETVIVETVVDVEAPIEEAETEEAEIEEDTNTTADLPIVPTAEEEPSPTSPKPDKRYCQNCFNCGETNHLSHNCPNPTNRKAYRQAIKNLRKEARLRRLTSSTTTTSPTDNANNTITSVASVAPALSPEKDPWQTDAKDFFHKVRLFISTELSLNIPPYTQGTSSVSVSVSVSTPVDPLHLLYTRRPEDQRKRLTHAITSCNRQHFCLIIDPITSSLLTKYNVTWSECEVNPHMNQNLTNAVVEGKPCDFNDQKELVLYGIGRLKTRCRYLYSLVLSPDVDICRSVRKMLLPSYGYGHGHGQGRDQGHNHEEREKKIEISSVGGGPGYDHVSFECLASFLCAVQVEDEDELVVLVPPTIVTTVYDLFASDWEKLLRSIDDSRVETTDAANSDTDTGTTNKNKKKRTHFSKTNKLTNEICDLRDSLDSPHNSHFRSTLPTADLFIFTFVLHENSAYLDFTSSSSSNNLVLEIFRYGKVGSIMLCSDACHTLWDRLMAAGERFGWKGEKRQESKKIMMGARAFCVLERMEIIVDVAIDVDVVELEESKFV